MKTEMKAATVFVLFRREIFRRRNPFNAIVHESKNYASICSKAKSKLALSRCKIWF